MTELNLRLREISLEDAELLLNLNNDEDIAKCVVGEPNKVTLQDQIRWINNLQYERNVIRFIVENNSQAVGTIIISNIDNHNKVGNFNIKMSKDFRGTGISQKAARLALRYAFDTLGLCCITAHVLDDNVVSQKFFQKMGFELEGVLKSRVIKNGKRRSLLSYSIVKPDEMA